MQFSEGFRLEGALVMEGYSNKRKPFMEWPTCEACGNWEDRAKYTYCQIVCMPVSNGERIDLSCHADKADPHLHRTCKRCGFQWLMDTAGSTTHTPLG